RINPRTSGGSKRITTTTSRFQDDISQILRASGRYNPPAKNTRNCRTTRPIIVLVPRSCPVKLEDILNGSTEGNKYNLDNSPHLIDIENGPSLEDRVQCRIKSIETMGSRQQNKNSSPGQKKKFFITSGPSKLQILKKNQEELSALRQHASRPRGDTTNNQPPQWVSRSFSSRYLVMGHISEENDLPTEVNRQFTCLPRPCAIRIRQICGSVPPRSCAKKMDLFLSQCESEIKNSCF
ncbi:hypothetical protein HID58_048085, partial [Brassica napus]